ncbi:MAG: phage tail protein, partial [Pseudomonadota bacterium]
IGSAIITLAQTIPAWVGWLALSAAIGERQRRRAVRAARDAYNASLRDQTITVRGSVSPSPIIYGETAVGGQLIYATSTGSKKEYLHLIVGLAMHEVHSIGQIYINDTAVTLDGNGDVQTSPYVKSEQIYEIGEFTVPASPYQITVAHTPSANIVVSAGIQNDHGGWSKGAPLAEGTDWTRSGATFTFAAALQGADVWIEYTYASVDAVCRIKKYTGSPNQTADPDLMAAAPSEWTSAHRLREIAYLYVRLKYDQDIWVTGIPNFKAVVRGKRIYHPYNNWLATEARIDGAIAGAPGTLPAGWSLQLPSGLAYSVVGSGVVDGLRYFDLRLQGTPANGTFIVIGCAGRGSPASTGQEWTAAAFVQIVAGTTAGVKNNSGSPRLVMLARDNADAGTEQALSASFFAATSGPLHANGLFATRTLSVATSVKTSAHLQAEFDGSAVDITLRIALPRLWQSAGNVSDTDPLRWSNIPAFIAQDYLLSPYGGRPTRTSAVDEGASNAAATICIEQVQISATPTYQQRYTFDGLLSTGDDRKSNLELIAQSMAGAINYSQGVWRPRAGAYTAPAITITEQDLAGGAIEIAPFRSRRDLINACGGRYLDANKGYVESAFPEWSSAAYQAEDGGTKLPMEIALPMVTDSIRAQRLAKIAVLRARESLTATLPCNLRQYATQVGDMVSVTLARYGWSAKPFRVIDRRFSPDAGVLLTVREEPSGLYDWNFGEAVTLADAANTNLPNPRSVTAPTIVGIASSLQYQRAGSKNSAVRWRMRVQLGTALDQITSAIEIQYNDGPSGWQPWSNVVPGTVYVDIEPVLEGVTYTVRARAMTAAGSRSAWTYATHTVNGTQWVKYSGSNVVIASVADGVAGVLVLRNGAPSASAYVGAEREPIDPNRTYRVRCWARKRTSAANGTFYMGVSLFDASGGIISGDGTFWFYAASGVTPAIGTWTEYTGTFGAGTARTFPSNARTMAPLFILNYAGTAGEMELQDLRIEDVIETDRLAPGATVEIYNDESADGSPCNWDTQVGGAFSWFWDKTVSRTLVVKAADKINVYVTCTGSSTYGGFPASYGYQAVGVDVVVTGSGKIAWTGAANATGNRKRYETTNQADGSKTIDFTTYTYTVPSDQEITVHAGGGLKLGSAAGTSSGKVIMRIERIKR